MASAATAIAVQFSGRRGRTRVRTYIVTAYGVMAYIAMASMAMAKEAGDGFVPCVKRLSANTVLVNTT